MGYSYPRSMDTTTDTTTDTPVDTDPLYTRSTTTTPVNYVFFMHVKTTNTWLGMAPAERFAFVDATLRPLIARSPDVSMRYFDSEAFNARCSDVIMWETADPLAYHFVVEELRENGFWGQYFEVIEIVASIEDAFALNYGVERIGAELHR